MSPMLGLKEDALVFFCTVIITFQVGGGHVPPCVQSLCPACCADVENMDRKNV